MPQAMWVLTMKVSPPNILRSSNATDRSTGRSRSCAKGNAAALSRSSPPPVAALVRTVVLQGAQRGPASGQGDAPAVNGDAAHTSLTRHVDRADRVPGAGGTSLAERSGDGM
jgi:hypothetical protein